MIGAKGMSAIMKKPPEPTIHTSIIIADAERSGASVVIQADSDRTGRFSALVVDAEGAYLEDEGGVLHRLEDIDLDLAREAVAMNVTVVREVSFDGGDDVEYKVGAERRDAPGVAP